jgi:hypothetical protein
MVDVVYLRLIIASHSPGQCRGNQCTLIQPLGSGDACLGDFQCAGNVRCQNGFCSDAGLSCTAADGSETGSTTTCISGKSFVIVLIGLLAQRQSTSLGFCRRGGCAATPTRNVGETCDSNEVCVGAESAYELPPQCGNVQGVAATCGGASTTCYASDGMGEGSDPICASGE